MPVQQNTYQQQSDFAAYCRTNKLASELQVRKDRVYHYRRLVYNVIDDSLQSAFPLTKNLLEELEWDSLVDTFFASHKSQSAQVWRMPEEFYLYWKSHPHTVVEKYPFLVDLLFFEWVEIEIFMMEDKPYPSFCEDGKYLSDSLAFNPEHKIIYVQYPVHLKNAGQINSNDKRDYYILIYREKETGKVQFMDISSYYTLVLENLLQGLTLKNILKELKHQYKLDSTDELSGNTIPFLEKLKRKKFILGFRDL